MSEQVNTPEVVSEDVVVMSGPPVGEQLRLAREARGLEVADIAQTLKLGPRQVEALEAGDWKGLPGNTFIRGFVRNYARLVQIDQAALMTLLDGCFRNDAGGDAALGHCRRAAQQTIRVDRCGIGCPGRASLFSDAR